MAGALYLGYVAIFLVREKKGSLEEFSLKQEQKAFRVGFFTNLLNPKATLFLLSLFTQFVTPKTPSALKIIYALIIPVSAFFWFGFLSYILTHPILFGKIQRYQWLFTRLMGVFLFGLSLYILVTASIGFL
jgi:threonine/homoserine/homoserine lactone efflux protein